MLSRIRTWFGSAIPAKSHDRLRLLFLTASFFCIIGGYTVAKELKDSVFSAIVGREYIPIAKMIFMFFLVPMVFVYSRLVDRLRRYQLLCFYSIFFGVCGLLSALLLGHSTIGLPNTDTSPYRVFGWFFYFFVECYSPFIVSVFWAFANSISNPDTAKNSYGIMVSGSKMGGVITAGLAWMLLSTTGTHAGLLLTDTLKHQILMGASSLLLLVVPVMIYLLIKCVSGRYLHGYEAAYQVEKKRGKTGKAKTGMFAGLKMLIKYPYVLGIFAFVFFYEIINSVLSYQRVGIAEKGSSNLSQMSTFLFKIIFVTHLLGATISLLGTRTLMKRLGERICLMLVPTATALLFVYFAFSTTQFAFLSFFVVLRSIHYGFSYPVRESLYIPTVKAMKFKSKSWIDAFGSKFAKTVGNLFNHFTAGLNPALFMTIETVFFGAILGSWFVAAYLLGRRFELAVANNEVIGAKEAAADEAKAQESPN